MANLLKLCLLITLSVGVFGVEHGQDCSPTAVCDADKFLTCNADSKKCECIFVDTMHWETFARKCSWKVNQDCDDDEAYRCVTNSKCTVTPTEPPTTTEEPTTTTTQTPETTTPQADTTTQQSDTTTEQEDTTTEQPETTEEETGGPPRFFNPRAAGKCTCDGADELIHEDRCKKVLAHEEACRGVNDPNEETSKCNPEQGLECSSPGNKCMCPTTKLFDPLKKKCVIKLNGTCTNGDDCGAGGECSAEKKCTCGKNEPLDDGFCYGAYDQPCNNESGPKCNHEKFFACLGPNNDRKCGCDSSKKHVFDQGTATCSMGEGGPCSMNDHTLQDGGDPKCGTNSVCSMEGNEHFCRCIGGFTPDGDGVCQSDSGSSHISGAFFTLTVAAVARIVVS